MCSGNGDQKIFVVKINYLSIYVLLLFISRKYFLLFGFGIFLFLNSNRVTMHDSNPIHLANDKC